MLNRVTGKGSTVWKYQQRPRQEELSDGERSPASEEVVFTTALSTDLTLVADSPTVKSTHHFPTGTGVLLPALMLGTANLQLQLPGTGWPLTHMCHTLRHTRVMHPHSHSHIYMGVNKNIC